MNSREVQVRELAGYSLKKSEVFIALITHWNVALGALPEFEELFSDRSLTAVIECIKLSLHLMYF